MTNREKEQEIFRQIDDMVNSKLLIITVPIEGLKINIHNAIYGIKECNHDKVYQNMILLSDPPQQRWICKNCGEEGRDTIGTLSSNEYQELKEKFSK
jgi:transposase-like protein